jgi:hypothetical protein
MRVSTPWFGFEHVGSNRRIGPAIALSLLFHAVLLGTLRVSDPEADSLSVVSDLFLRIELEDGKDEEHDRPPPVAQPDTPAPPSDLLVASHATPQRAMDVQTVPNLPEPLSTPSEEQPLPEQSQSSADATIVTTVAESDRVDSVDSELVRQESEQIAIPTTEQGLLTRQVMQGMKVLQTADTSQVRLSWQDGERTYVAMLTSQPATDGMDIERATVEIETEENGERLRTKMQMKRLAFSHFTQLVDRWDTDVQLHDDVISGRFHSNSEIVLAYDRKIAPLFMGRVTTAARGFGVGFTIGRRKRDDIFPQGLETGAEKVKFPAAFDQRVGNADVRSFAGDTRITFYSDGTYSSAERGSDTREYREMNQDTPTYLVGAPDSSLYVSGTVRGKVLIYSPDRIVIEDDLTYARNPRSSGASDDYLGLVSDRYIEIAGPSVTGPGDLKINAAVYAKRRFVVTHVAALKTATLYIYGSLTAGSLSETEPRYATHIEFDPRFERLRPPGFPLTNKYEVEAWDGRWQTVSE